MKALLAHGVFTDAVDNYRVAVLMRGPTRTRNDAIPEVAQIAARLLDYGERITQAMHGEPQLIGSCRIRVPPGILQPRLRRRYGCRARELYRLFGVAPVGPRIVHDGVSPIVASDGDWQHEHQEALCELLVLSIDAASMVQAIRATGRLSTEFLGNDGGSLDSDFRTRHASVGSHLAHVLNAGSGDLEGVQRLCESAVEWVGLDSMLIPLGPVSYER